QDDLMVGLLPSQGMQFGIAWRDIQLIAAGQVEAAIVEGCYGAHPIPLVLKRPVVGPARQFTGRGEHGRDAARRRRGSPPARGSWKRRSAHDLAKPGNTGKSSLTSSSPFEVNPANP